MQPRIFHQDQQQCHYTLSRDKFRLNDLYDKQTDNYHWGHCTLSAHSIRLVTTTFSTGVERKGRL